MLVITKNITIADSEIEITAIRAQGSGGQNVNKVSNAVHLRFDINKSQLPEEIKLRLLQLRDHRITEDGVIILKAQQYRSLEKNRDDAIARLHELISRALVVKKKRKATKPTISSQKKRVETKSKRGKIKSMRKKVREVD